MSVKKLFDQHPVVHAVVNKNMPRVAGVLRQSEELKESIQLPMQKLKTDEHGFVIHYGLVCLFVYMYMYIHNYT